MSPTRCNLLILLIHLINGLNVDQYIPTDVNCAVNSSITNPSDDQKNLTISWYLDHHVMSGVKSFNLSCDCVISDQHIFKKAPHHCSPPCSHQVSLNTCYDECQCRVRSILRGLPGPTVNQSNFSTCYIRPTVVPKAPPVIISHPARNDDGKSTEIIFKLPAEDLYCDSTDVINSITVNVTDHVDGSHQYIYNQPEVLRTDEGNYKFAFQVKYHQFWRPFNVTISVNNSVGSSPFSDHMIVRGANNGDITRNDYELEFYYDGNVTSEVSTLQFYWNLSRKAQHIMNSQFITGFKIIVEHEPGNDTIYTTSLTKNLTLNITLEPHQWYLIIGRILTKDNDTWGPEPVYEYFQTPGLPGHSSSSSDNCLLVIILSIMILIILVVVTILLYITRAPTKLVKICHNDCVDDDDDSCSVNDKMNEIIGTVAGSYAEHRCDPSTVENISNAGFTKNQANSTTGDLDSIMYIDECDISILKTTAV